MISDLIPHDPPRRDLNASYPLRSRFWFGSVVAHILWVAVVVRIPLSTPTSKRPIYDQFIRPLESRTLVYRPPKKVPAAAPEKQVGDTPDPRGKLIAPRTVIATAPKAQSQQQIIWKPVDAPEIKADVPAPTVVERIAALVPPPPKLAPKQFTPPPVTRRDPKLPTDITAALTNAPTLTVTPATPNTPRALPPPPKVAPKQFTPPPVTKSDPKLPSTEITAALTNAPTVAVAPATPNVPKALPPPPPKIAPKQFVPPPASAREPKLATRTEVNETLTAAAPVSVAQNGVAVSVTNLPPPPKTKPKQFTPPPAASRAPRQVAKTEVNETLASVQPVNGTATNTPGMPSVTSSRLPGPPKDALPAPVPAKGNDQANIAIASVNPSPAAEVPTSSRSGQFSVAPVAGEPSSGVAPPGALTVPNVAVREPAVPPKPTAKSNTVIYAEKVRAATSATFTVPLRAINRAIPKSIDAHFPGRTVYAVVIPIENLPAYGADWILWFAESAPQPGTPPSVRAPIPFRKLELLEKGREPSDTRLQIAATLSTDGRLSNLKVLTAVSTAIQALAIEDLSSWEWKPATRNNVAISIEAVFEIPFRLAVRP
ncbi:MAG: energy transducer TonB [Bryobacteraceae bacterium]